MKVLRLVCLTTLLLALVACGGGGEEVTPAPTAVAQVATATAEPTQEPTAVPTATAEPTATATTEPTATATTEPTATPIPEPTATRPRPTPTRQSAQPTAEPKTTATSEPTPAPSTATTTVDLAELDAVALLQTAEENARQQETSIVEQIVASQLPQLSQTQTQTCYVDVASTDQYCQTETSVQVAGSDPINNSNEIVYLDGRLWLRQEEGEWEELPTSFLEEAGFQNIDQLNNLSLSQYLATAEVVRQVRLDGVEAYEVTFELDVRAYYEAIVNEDAAAQLFTVFDEYTGSGTMWIGVESELVQRFNLQIQFSGSEGALTVTNKANYRFNEPIEIPNPEEE